MSLLLSRTPSFSAALPHALAAWRQRGGLLVLPRREAATSALLAEAGAAGAVIGREAITPAALRGRVIAAAGLPEPDAASWIDVRLGLREVLDSVDLTPFGESAQTPGFLSGIERAIGELRGAGVTAEALHAAAEAPTARCLAEIHAGALSVPHPSDVGWRAAEAAATLTAFPPVTVAGFDDLDPAAWALLRALGVVADVEVVMPFDPARVAFEARHCRQIRWGEEATVRDLPAAPPAGPAALARRLFEDGPPLAEPPELWLVGAAGTRGMLRAALEEGLAAVADGTELAHIALVVPRLAELRDDLERLLDDWGIPAERSTRVRALEAPLLLALTHLLQLGRLAPDDPGALEHLLGWLRTPYSGADPAEVDRFEVHARRGGVARRGELMARWDGAAIRPARHLVSAAARGPRAELVALLQHGEEALRRAASAHALPSRADLRDRAALATLGGLTRALPEGMADPNEPPSSRPRGPLPPGVLGELLADLTFTEREGPAGGLAVHDFASIRGREYELVVIAGLDGDGYPTRAGADPFLGPVRAALGHRLPPRAPGTSDDDGREVAPSPYWVEVARLAGRPIDHLDRRTGARGEVCEDPEGAPTEREALRALALDGKVAAGPLAEAAARRSRPIGVPADAFHGLTRFRVTELEALLRCSYGWFRDSYLAPEELEQLIDPRFEGNLAHEALHRLYVRMRAEAVGPCGLSTLSRYREALEELLPIVAEEWRPPGAGAAYTALVERLRRHLAAMLGREAALGSRMIPTIFEERMEDATLLGSAAPGVAVSGRLDRLDVSPDGAHALVVDYKRSGGDFAIKSDDVTRRLQLPLYGLMAKNTLGLSLEPAGGLYMGLLTDDVDGAVRDDVADGPAVGKSCRVSAERWAEITDDAVEAVRGAVARLRAGELAPPSAKNCSFWCRCEDLWR
jgi:RecB family exonuclease